MTPLGQAALSAAFFERGADVVARDLIGRILVSEARGTVTAGRIIEVEAYLGAPDPASHAFRYRRHRRNRALYRPAGTWYVYLSYGIHWCANLVAGPPGEGAAVLLRAVEPLEGLATMRRRRGTRIDLRLCSGPGRLCQALGITRGLDGRAMVETPVRVLGTPPQVLEPISRTPRIGITQAADWPLRFVLADSPWASGRRGSPGRSPQRQTGGPRRPPVRRSVEER